MIITKENYEEKIKELATLNELLFTSSEFSETESEELDKTYEQFNELFESIHNYEEEQIFINQLKTNEKC